MIKNKILLNVLFLSLLSTSVNAQTNSTPTATTNSPTSKAFKTFDLNNFVFTLENEFRAKSTGSAFFYEHNDFQAKYLLVDKYLDVFTDYRLIFKNSAEGNNWKNQSMFLEGFNVKYPQQKWGKINLRQRLEIGLNQSPSKDSYQWNVFPKYNVPWKLTKYEINPFIADESFFDTQDSMGFVKNRVYVGVDYKLTPKIKGSTWYYYETSAHSSAHANCLVTQIRFEF